MVLSPVCGHASGFPSGRQWGLASFRPALTGTPLVVALGIAQHHPLPGATWYVPGVLSTGPLL